MNKSKKKKKKKKKSARKSPHIITEIVEEEKVEVSIKESPRQIEKSDLKISLDQRLPHDLVAEVERLVQDSQNKEV